jgi:hypothetical protein
MALIFTPPLDFETPMKVEDEPLTMPPAEKTEEVWQPENDFRTGILTVFQPPRPAERGRQEIARFPSGSASSPVAFLRLTHFASERSISRPSHRSCAQSQIACVGTTLQSQLICAGNRT